MTSTFSTASESKPRSRRAVLAAAVGGVGAWLAGAVGHASPVRADGEAMLVGGEYITAASVTRLRNETNGAVVFTAESAGAGDAIRGTSNGGEGVSGSSQANNGVRGSSATSVGVSGLGGVAGVAGSSPSGTGLVGATTTGLALQTFGRVKFSTSGVATIAAGNSSKVVNPGVNVKSGAFVLLTPKTNIGGRALWFTTNPTTDRFTIRMSSPRSSMTRIAWLFVG